MEAAEIKALREALGLSQEQLARHLGVSFVSVSRWERGLAKPSPLATEKLDQIRREWEDELSPEDIILKKGELVFPKKSSQESSFGRAIIDLSLYDWIEKHRPGYTLNWAIIKPYGRGRLQVTRIGVKPKGS